MFMSPEAENLEQTLIADQQWVRLNIQVDRLQSAPLPVLPYPMILQPKRQIAS